MPRARIIPFLAVAVGLLPVGCFQAYNPTYFPNWGYAGPIDRTHAKPSGGAYFKNFDPKACKIELTPLRCDNPTGTQQVLIASVVDADGMPRRSRRVEWIIDGPGYIVEVDESGWYSGRGYKVDNKYAVSYTDYKEHTITRGSDNPRDSFTIRPGQSWCVVSSAVEGQTTVTAYAPEVYNWDSGRVTSVLTWGPPLPGSGPAPSLPPGGIAFPPPVVSRAGGEAALTTSITPGKNDHGDELKVRYKVLDGPPAVLLAGLSSAGGAGGSTVLYGSGRAETEVATDTDGKAAVTVRQPSAKPGTTRVAVEVLKTDPDTGRETVVKRSETRVEWASADLTLNVKAPKIAPLGQEVPITLLMANVGKADSQPVTVRAALPDGAEFVRSDPPPTVQKNKTLAWTLGAVPGGQTKPVTLTVRPTRKGTLELAASADTPDGLRAEQKASIPVDTAGLAAVIESPRQAGVGDRVAVTVAVTNTGAVPIDGATAWLTLDDGLTAEDGSNQPELPLGVVPPGQTKRADVRVSAKKSGRYAVRANVTADGGLTARADGAVEFRRSELTATITGPNTVNVGEEAAWQIVVTNGGEVPLNGITVRTSLPKGLTAKGDQTELPVGTLAAGEKRTVRIAATGAALLNEGSIRVVASTGDGPGGLTAKSDLTVSVVGRPALTVEMPDPPGVVSVGRRSPVRIVVRNTGDAPAKRVEVTVSGSPELTVYGGSGPDRTPVRPEGGKLTIPLASLPPGASAVFTADVGATKPGAARLTAEVRADHLTQPVRDEQSARVVP